MKRKHGFTLIEILIVVAIIAILAAILLPAIMNAINAAAKGKVRQECVSIKGAIEAYNQQYGKLPVAKGGPEKFTDPSTILKALIGKDTTLNPRSTVYFESDNIDATGKLEDEWGQPYIIYLDSDYNGEVSVGTPPQVVRARVVVQSKGRDTVEGNPLDSTHDDIATVQ